MNTDNESLELRMRRVERSTTDVPLFQRQPIPDDYRVNPVSHLAVKSANIAARLTAVTLTWVSPDHADLKGFEIWIARLTNGSIAPYLAVFVNDSPATFNVVSDAAGTAIAFVRTVLKNAIITPLNAAPSVTFQIF